MSADDPDRRDDSRGTRRGRTARVCGVGLGLALAATPTEAFWTATSTPGSAGRSVATTVADGPTPVVVVSNRRDLQVSWGATTLGDGTPVTGYVVRRYDESGAEQTVTGGCAGTVTTTSCTEAAVPDGLWTYRVTPRFESWAGAPGAAGADARTDTTPPRNDIDRQAVSGGSVRIGAATYYYRGRDAGSFRLVNRLTDPGGSGPRESVTGALSASGWSHVPSSVSTPEGGPYVSNLFSWAAGTTSEFDVGVAGIDQYGNTAPATIAVRLDNDAPTGGAIDHADGPTSSRSVRVTVADVDDARSGVGSRILEGAFAPLSGNVCGAWSAWQTATQNPAASVSFAVSPGSCYRARYVVVDRVGNVLTVGSPKVIKARDQIATITATPGLVGYWRLSDNTNTLAATRGANGTYHGGPTRQQTGAIVGDDDRSVFFDGTDDHARVGRTVSSSFSLEFWFRSDQGIGTGSNWYDGAGMVDAEVGGVANDFGVSLLADGRVAAGVGNPDRAALSGAGFNDNQWHHVVMTRNAGNGVVELWVDGQRRGTVTGGTQALDASAHIDIGRLQTGVNHYRGRIDEVAVYDRVLPAATVENHWRSGLP